ncbi:MAG: clostripain-related cysteine peptidase [Prevotella sp.]|jgi:hypothetical protein
MRHPFRVLLILIVAICSFTSCSDDESVDITKINKQTILVFMPWTGDDLSNIVFKENLDSIEGAIIKAKRLDCKLLVFLSTSATTSDLYEITYQKGVITHTPIKTYAGKDYTTAAGITQILNDVQTEAYALNYAMMIGCHGCGWTYKNDWTNYPYQAKMHFMQADDASWNQAKASPYGHHRTNTPTPPTRFFGSINDMESAIDITDLATGIQDAGIKMQFILFDDCYMANVETAYELRHATNFLIGSTSEVMLTGMPYQTVWHNLATSTPAYDKTISAFHTYYQSYIMPYGALSAIDCRKVEGLAEVMLKINKQNTFDESLRDSLQVLDGFETSIFYDMGRYVDKLCAQPALLSDFHARLSEVVKATATTDTLFSALHRPFTKVKNYSGLTISDPSKNAVALKGKEKTAWWIATH